MKNNSLTGILTAVLAFSAVLALVFCYLYIRDSRELRNLQGQVIGINNHRAAIASLANDAMQYSEKNQAINPILESMGLKQGKATPAPAKPAGK
jgi:hypothetical protein